MDLKGLLKSVWNPNQMFGALGYALGLPTYNKILGSVSGKYLGTNLTPAEEESNRITIEEAEKQRNWEERMSNTQYQRGVKDMQSAGLNVGLMYGNGAQAAPTPSGASASSVSPSFSGLADLIQLLKLPTEIKNIRANTAKTDADTDNVKVLTQINSIVARYKVQFTEAEISQIQASTSDLVAHAKLNQSNASYIDDQDEAQRITNRYLDERIKAEISKINSESSSLDASAKRSLAEAAFTNVQCSYAEKYGVLMSNNDMVALASYLCSVFGVDIDSASGRANSAVGIITKGNQLIEKGINSASAVVDKKIEELTHKKSSGQGSR